jgi:hypothetical protein
LPEPLSDTSGSCVTGVYVFFKINFYKDSNEKGDNLMKTRMKKLISISTIPDGFGGRWAAKNRSIACMYNRLLVGAR